MHIQSINPFNGQPIKTYTEDSPALVEKKIKIAHKAWFNWKETSFKQRSELMRKAGSVLGTQKEALAALMAKEMGKPLKEGIAEIEKCALACDYYAENAATFLEDRMVKTDAYKSYVSYQPIGVVLAVMPWNFPFWQVFRFIAPSIMAGNCGILKHASNVPGCGKAIEAVMVKAGFPKGVFQNLLIGSKQVSQVIANPLVKAVTLTGSTEAGQKVAAQAAGLIKKTVLELGGSDPYIVLEDADLEEAATICANSRLINNGQSCIAAKRFILVREIEKSFTEIFKEKMSAKIAGDPYDAGSDLGPMARIDLRNELHRQVQQNIRAGARLILGGRLPKDAKNNAFYAPTILTGIKKQMGAYSEEIFGPVASIITAKDTKEAVRIANDTSFGLGAAIFTKDRARGEKIARESLQAGACFVNAFVKSDPRLPFGGINQSGYGRELGQHGIYEFVNIKSVYIG
ncbi:MAG TPA: NAD-dependent succinate-semialdehyde dehydrogenase [Arachidicoccus sp.]|nr:NAD-dependent succinate-semialdehyde dehydrogenase [Arachidicoccus sp.]